MQPISRQQLHRNKYLRATSFEGKSDQGDSFRIPKGDRQQAKPQPMASVDDDGAAGEISPESSFTTVILRPVTPTGQGMDEDSSIYSSPPTHPVFFQPIKIMAAPKKKPGSEDVCPSPMAAPVSPSVSACAVLETRMSLKGTGLGGAAGSVMLDRFIRDGDGDVEQERNALGNEVDTNVLAALSNGRINGSREEVSPVLASERMAEHEV